MGSYSGNHKRNSVRYRRKGSQAGLRQTCLLGRTLGIVLILAMMRVVVTSADEPDALTPTPTVTSTVVESVTAVATPTELPAETPSSPTPTPTIEQQATSTVTPTPSVTRDPEPDAQTPVSPTNTVSPTIAPTAAPSTPVPTATPPPTPTSAPVPSLPGTAHLAVLVSESVISVGGTGNSEVFVFLQDVQPGVQGFELHLAFDPNIVHVADADGDASNGTQIAVATFFGSPGIVENRADNATGAIALTLTQGGEGPIQQTNSWQKVATITWVGRAEGNSVVAVDSASHFTASDGRLIAPDAAYNGMVFARMPGRMEGIVKLQGREDHQSAQVTSALAATRLDTGQADKGGHFEITASHGEGFYTLLASAPGYLSAEGDRPVKLTVGSVVDLGEVTLVGGDANGDNRIDIRDLSYVAWHFDEYDAQADINGDGQVDILDLSLTAGNFGRIGPTTWHVPDQDG